MALTVKRIATLNEPGRYLDQHGLYLQVLSPSNRSWLLRYERQGRERWMGLGPLHTVTLADARERARKARLLLLDNIDPIDAKRSTRAAQVLAQAKALTFAEATQLYFDQHSPKWKNAKHAQQFLTTLRDYAFPTIGKLSVGDVDTGLVLKCLEPIWKTKTTTASRLRGRIENVLDWCTVRNYRTGDNPARWAHLRHVLPALAQVAKPVHHAALPFTELAGFLEALRARQGVDVRALEFTILTAGRTGEVLGATWSEVDLDQKVWTIPANRMKGGKAHRVPLSAPVVDLLEALPREDGNPFVFIGPKAGSPLSPLAMIKLLARIHPGITTHGFRSTFMDWCHERTSYSKVEIDMALAHAVGDKVEASYRRGDLFDKRRRLMDEWGRFAGRNTDISAKVIPLARV